MPSSAKSKKADVRDTCDVIVIGGGFAGVYQVHRLVKAGMTVRAIEKGSDVGGTWYWNRYPGARCDIESLTYSYSFDADLQREWKWPQRYAEQPDILRYIQHVADRFDVKRYFTFNTIAETVVYDEASMRWHVRTSTGEELVARFVVMASGPLSVPVEPSFPGQDEYAGPKYMTSRWPHEGVDFTGKRVGIVGTGSSSIQASPLIAKQAKHLHVFQRTPQFAIPAWNRPLTADELRYAQENYDEIRRLIRLSDVGVAYDAPKHGAKDAKPEDLQQQLDMAWNRGGYLMLAAYPDLVTDMESNRLVSEWVKEKIRAKIKDPVLAEKLMPTYPFGARRLCVDTDYFEMFNRDNVTLVDLRESAFDRFTSRGIRTKDGTEYELDAVVFATGFDALTGALLAIDIRGRGGVSLRERWRDQIQSYLGVMISGFPNLFTVNGPGSPSGLYSMVGAIEQHVDLITDTIEHLRREDLKTIEPLPRAEKAWAQHVHWISEQTVYSKVESWYTGHNVAGKPKGFQIYAAGGPTYFEFCKQMVDNGYRGFAVAH